MRLGVSAKIFIAYAVLLAAFAGNATYAVVELNRARQRVLANQAYLEIQVSVDAAMSSLIMGAVGKLQPDLSRALAEAPADEDALRRRPDPNVALALRVARGRLDDALATVDRAMAREPVVRGKFESPRRQIARLRDSVEGLAAGLGAVQAASDPKVRLDFESRMATLVNNLGTVGLAMRGEGRYIAAQLALDEDQALSMTLMLGGVGFVVALLVGIVMMRTLRPLLALRQHAREVAAGDYARRTGVRSRDEIGDLAREFDAMAAAIQEREHRLIRSERLATVGRMAAQITHEIRNPLASIGLYAELLGDEVEADEARKLLGSITSEVDRLTEITETYLRFARLPRPKLEREDLAAVVASAMEFSRAEFGQAGIALEMSIEPALPDVAADEGQIRQALLNLVRNAREAMPGGGRLRVEVGRGPAGQVRVSVGDTGPGIADEHLAKIFDPFFSTKEKGTGLGLALVQQIVAEHGGRIEVASRAGQGTAFVVSLPALAPRAEAPPPAPDRNDAPGRNEVARQNEVDSPAPVPRPERG